MHLWSDFYVAEPLFERAQLDELQSIITERLPSWSKLLRVAVDEDASDGVFVGRPGKLFDGIQALRASNGRLHSAVLSGAHEGLTFFLSHSEDALPVELNDFSIEILHLQSLETQAVATWAGGAFWSLVAGLPIRYARSRTREEFVAKNIVDDERGVWAIGVDLTDAIPGLYWLNYFGPEYVELIGRDRLLSAPAHEVKPVGEGVLIALGESPEDWQTPEYRQREQAVIRHLGEQYFFSRSDPNRKTVAPDFGASRK